MSGFAWVTLATNDSYSLGALVLAHSLRRVGSRHDLAVLITPGVTESMREKLASVFTLVKEVNVLDSQDEANLAVLRRPELGITFTKLHCWRLTQYEKCVFIDADALVVRNCDELFEREELSAAPDVGWPDCFNSGVFVYRPSEQTFASLTSFAASQGSFDGADQGLLNMYFSDWAHKDISKHLPFIYNMCSTATYSYAPAFKQYGENVRIVHFIASTKPWLQYFDTLTGIVQPSPGCDHLQPLLQIWWNIFCDSVHPQLTDVMVASNLTTIWHDSISCPKHYDTYDYTSQSYDFEQNAHSEINSRPPDFSEFKDPWDNYSENANHSTQNNVQQTDNKQYYCDTNINYSQPSQIISHNHCGAEPPPTLPSSFSHCDSEHREDYNFSQSYENDQILHQSCSLESQSKQEHVEHSRENQVQIENENSVDESKTKLNVSTENLNRNESRCFNKEIDDKNFSVSTENLNRNAFYHFNKEFDDQSDSHNNFTDNENERVDIHIENYSQNTQIANNSIESSTLNVNNTHDSRQNSIQKFNHKQRPTDSHNPTSSHTQAPSTDPYNVATKSELSVPPCIENANGGLAGALSKLTMGESRTAEQQAIEDHMRKQNWEQGHIDFMGRDSFDNILKKIQATLSTAPPRQPSPIKETGQPEKSSGKSSEVEAAVEESEVALPVLATEDQAESDTIQGLSEDVCQKISKEDKILSINVEDRLKSLSGALNIISEADNTSQQIFLIQSTTESAEKSVSAIDASPMPKEIELLQKEAMASEILTQAILDIKQSEILIPEVITETEVPCESSKIIDTGKNQQHTLESTNKISSEYLVTPSMPSELLKSKSDENRELLQSATQIVSEATTECPVPIQVAESVLQAEPKESVSEDPRLVIEAVVSSIVSPVQESAAAVTQTFIEPGQTLPISSAPHSQQLNGYDHSLQAEFDKTPEPSLMNVSRLPRTSNIASAIQESTPTAEQQIQPVVETDRSVELQLKSDGSSTVEKLEETLTNIPAEEEAKLTSQRSKLTVKLHQDSVSEGAVCESMTDESLKITCTVAATCTTPTEVSLIPVDKSKDLKIPETPTVIGPTPPTSPPLEMETIQTVQKEIEKPLKSDSEIQPLFKTDSKSSAEAHSEIQAKPESTKQTETEAKLETAKQPKQVETQPNESSENQAKPEAAKQEETQPNEPSESQKTAKKVVKKVVKKTESDTPSSPESEGSSKKTVKKVVKKVVKKPKEGEEGEGTSSADKTKKVVKTVKKLRKTSSTNLETDKTVPETPPPSASSEVPIPPKRKSKSNSSAKVTDKKPEES